jgi:hypothetical protein
VHDGDTLRVGDFRFVIAITSQDGISWCQEGGTDEGKVTQLLLGNARKARDEQRKTVKLEKKNDRPTQDP